MLHPSVLEAAELDELVGVGEISEYLGKCKQNVAQHYTRRDDFPAPAAELATGRYWRRGDVEAWYARFRGAQHGRKKSAESRR